MYIEDIMNKERFLFGYRLIKYDERGMSNIAVCWNQWFLTKNGAAKEYLKPDTHDVIIMINNT